MNPTGKRGLVLRRLWASEEFGEFKPTVYDWCRLAAFIDGEGCVDINTCKSNPSFTVRIQIGNTNPRLTAWLVNTFGGSIKILSKGRAERGWKNEYLWSCMSTRAAWVLHNCLPWMLLKDGQALLLMNLQRNIDETRQGRGRRVSEESMQLRRSIYTELRALNKKGVTS